MTIVGAAVNVAMTTWESSDIGPEMSTPLLEAYACVIVPSEFCAANLIPRLDHHGVKVVPHTFDPDFWRPTPEPDICTSGVPAPRDRTLRFYSLGAWSERKNHPATIAAYLHAFTRADKVSLSISSQGADYDQLRSLLARAGMNLGELPEIMVDANPMTEDELLRFHDQHDVFCSSSRGEGWGLPLFEAAVMGKTILSPFCSGEIDFLVGYAGLRMVESRQTPCFWGRGKPRVAGDRIVGETASAVPGMTCKQTWAEVDIVDMAQRMRGVYAQHQAGNTFTVASDRDKLVERFGYDVVAPHLIQTLEEIIA